MVAVFDFDGTLTLCDSLFPFLRMVAGPGKFWLGLLRHAPTLLGYFAGFLRESRAKEALLRHFLGGWERATVDELARQFVATRLPALMNPAALARLRGHRAQGDRLILLSASPDIWLQPWAEEQGVAEVISTKVEEIDGRLTGRLGGRNCRGAEKVHRLKKVLGSLEAVEIHAYGDSPADQSLLKLVDHPHYRNFGQAGWRAAWALVRALI